MLDGILFIVGALCCARYSFQYFIVVRLMRQPCRHIAAVGHAFVLFDFMCGVLAEIGIGKVGKEVVESSLWLFPFLVLIAWFRVFPSTL